VERDYRLFRRRYGDVVRPAPPASRGQALIASLSYATYQLKLEGMFAKAFQFQGLEPVVLVPTDSQLPQRYFELFGIERFVTLDDYLGPEREAEARREAEQLLALVRTPADLKTLTFRGADVGREALSTVSRYLHEGGVDLQDPRAKELLRELLPAAVRAALAAEALLSDLQPELVLFNERNYADQGPICDIALLRALNVIQFVSGFEDDTMVFKRYTAETKAIHPRSLADASWERVKQIEWTEERDRELEHEFVRRYDKDATFLARWNQGWTRRQSRGEIAAKLGLDPHRKTAVIFSHVLWDANMFYGEDLFADQEEWFVETVRAACGNDRINWIVKLHPANVWKLRRDAVAEELDEIGALRDRIGELPAHVAVLRPESDVSTWSIFRLAAAGVTIRGSVGIELPCFGVPVLTAGTGFYSGRGFTSDSSSPGEYLERLRTIESVEPLSPEQVLLARKHAYAIFRLRPTRFTSFRTVFRPPAAAGHPLDHDLELLVRSRGELEAAPDLRRFADWAVSSRALDYLEPLPERAPPAYAESRAS
jgi:hypothetical protein